MGAHRSKENQHGTRSLTGEEPEGNESLLTILVAFVANTLIAIAKSVAAIFSGSASMVAEAAHSWVDTLNEVFLYIAQKRAEKPRDKTHIFGYGREAYVWSMVASFALFAAGAVASIMRGVQQIIHTEGEHGGDFLWSYIILGIAFVLEAISFLQAVRHARGAGPRLHMSPMRFILRTSDPTVRAVFVEDAGALIGIVLAALGLLLSEITGSAVWDALGSIAVGLLLAIMALYLFRRNREFLVGEVANEHLLGLIRAELLADARVERITFLYSEYVGPGRVFVAAAVDLVGDEVESSAAHSLRDIGRHLEEYVEVERALITLGAAAET